MGSQLKPAVVIAVSCLLVGAVIGAHSDRVLLRDISALTLRNGMQTSYQRSQAVPQLKCVGGTAGCRTFVPQVVQCQNRGFDGSDVQWECKTDMDNEYRFGQVEVTCEGYDYPEDPYVLRGSCGLEYTLDYTKEGHQKQRQQHQQHQYYGEDYHDRSSDSYNYKKSESGLGSLLALGAAAFVIYLIYKTCLSGDTHPSAARPTPDAPPPPYSRHDSGHGNQAPPAGFKPEFTSGHTGSSGGYSGCSSDPGYSSTGYTNTGYTNTNTNANNGTGGGFWSGMATGGLLGYLFGGSNQGYNSGYYGNSYTRRQQPYGSSWGNSWFGNSRNTGGSGWFGGSGSTFRSSSMGSFSGGGGSSGTRTASGFGGTKRR